MFNKIVFSGFLVCIFGFVLEENSDKDIRQLLVATSSCSCHQVTSAFSNRFPLTLIRKASASVFKFLRFEESFRPNSRNKDQFYRFLMYSAVDGVFPRFLLFGLNKVDI